MKFLVISFDKQAHDYLTQNTTMISHLMAGAGKDSDRSKDSVAAPQVLLIVLLIVWLNHRFLSSY
jgi:flagellar biogenesis protein FliO